MLQIKHARIAKFAKATIILKKVPKDIRAVGDEMQGSAVERDLMDNVRRFSGQIGNFKKSSEINSAEA